MRRRWAAGLIAGLCLVTGSAAAQTVNVTLSPNTNAPGLGKVVRGGSSTVFIIDAVTGTVTQTGPAIRLTVGGVNTPEISISCGGSGGGNCNTRKMRVQISGSGSGSAVFAQFSVGPLTCPNPCNATYDGGAPTPAASLDFRTTPIRNGSTAKFKLGSQVTVASSGATGLQTFTVSVTATLDP